MDNCKCKPAKSYAERIIEYREFVSLVKQMREAQKDCMAWEHAMAGGYELAEEEWEDYGRSQATRVLFEKDVDEYLKKMEDQG